MNGIVTIRRTRKRKFHSIKKTFFSILINAVEAVHAVVEPTAARLLTEAHRELTELKLMEQTDRVVEQWQSNQHQEAEAGSDRNASFIRADWPENFRAINQQSFTAQAEDGVGCPAGLRRHCEISSESTWRLQHSVRLRADLINWSECSCKFSLDSLRTDYRTGQ